jgi:Rrf2 family nitric oxide-sensitive transcriptional repressor
MRLTSYTDFTLRALMSLAVNPALPSTIAEIARTYGISETHVMKIVHQSGIAGDIENVRGKGRGVRLGRPASAINMGGVVRRTEPDMDLVARFSAPATCAIAPSCVLQSVQHDALVYADAAGLIQVWNAGAERLFGFTPAEAIGQSFDIINPKNIQGRQRCLGHDGERARLNRPKPL